jgi:crotonobetainyl-CoA:carnitine CoA-transferase CaiB-like acyl-CoA transferase
MEHEMTAFEGVRVVEFAQGMAGPLAGMIMADNGAEVIKVEPPEGDWARGEPGFLMWNRGKKSLVLNLTKHVDRETALRLSASADVLLETYRPGVAERLGISYSSISAVNPRVVYCSISGFGETGPLAAGKGYEGLVAAKSGQLVGLGDMQGVASGQRRDRPIFKAIPVGSYAASQLALQGVGAALLQRQRHGHGQHVKTSLLQGAMSLFIPPALGTSTVTTDRSEDPVFRGIGLAFLTAECKDGKWIQMCARQDHHFRNWLRALELDDVLSDPRYSHAPVGITSLEDITALEARLRERMRTRTQADWMRMFIEDYDIGADPFLTPAEFLRHPQMVETGRVVQLEDPTVGKTTQLGPLILFSDTPAVIERPAPRLGEHTNEVCAALVRAPRSRTAGAAKGGIADGIPSGYPLAGVTILEVAYFMAAPLGTTRLAELGARVIKVEPEEGDPWRRLGPMSVQLLLGKESIVLDLKTDKGRDVLQKLIARSDALLTSFRPGVPERLGFDFLTAIQINPRLVYLYGGSYGSKGPQSHRAAFHSTPSALAGGGILQAGQNNRPVDDAYPDPASGLAVATAIVVGLLARERTGKGQYLETTMLCSSAYALSQYLVLYEGAPQWRLPDTEQRGQSALYRLYECASGWCFVAVLQEKEWRSLANALGHPEWIGDPRFSAQSERLRNDAELSRLLEANFATRPAHDWEAMLSDMDVPVVEVSSTTFGASLVAQNLMTPASHAEFGNFWRMPPKIDFSTSSYRAGPACSAGEHTLPILQELGYGSAEIEELIRVGAVGAIRDDARRGQATVLKGSDQSATRDTDLPTQR